jgi:hypothetical protein
MEGKREQTDLNTFIDSIIKNSAGKIMINSSELYSII